jgi:hypothetical protein
MPTTEHCRWWQLSGVGLKPSLLWTDRATLNGLLTDSHIPGLVATPILKPVLPDVACGKNDSKLGDKETHHGKQKPAIGRASGVGRKSPRRRATLKQSQERFGTRRKRG